MYLEVESINGSDWFDVYNDKNERVGQVCPSGEDEWAAYIANEMGRIRAQRIGTYPTVAAAVAALDT